MYQIMAAGFLPDLRLVGLDEGLEGYWPLLR